MRAVGFRLAGAFLAVVFRLAGAFGAVVFPLAGAFRLALLADVLRLALVFRRAGAFLKAVAMRPITPSVRSTRRSSCSLKYFREEVAGRQDAQQASCWSAGANRAHICRQPAIV